MIKHHPSTEILQAFVSAELPTSVSVAVSIHIDMCPICKANVDELTATEAESVLVETQDSFSEEFDFEEMFEAITSDNAKAETIQHVDKFIDVANKSIPLPRALTHLEQGDWSQLGKLRRSRVKLDDGKLRSGMLYIDAGGDVPHHTHNGFEITLLLDGSFSDDMGEYVKGDFIWLDGNHNHQPATENGCLCYTVVSDSLHFSQGLSRLLNPIGNLIY